jgi:hypothetical protein
MASGFARASFNSRRRKPGQAQILAGILFLFLVPTSLIVAQNASVNLTGDAVSKFDNSTLPFMPAVNITEAGLNFSGTDIPQTGTNLFAEISIPERSARNDEFTAKASITNNGTMDAPGVRIDWIIPRGFSVEEGEASYSADIPAASTHVSTLRLRPGLGSDTGVQEINVLVRYNG